MNDQELRDEINKRVTLNWLTQGAAMHTGMTFHYLVRDELSSLDPRLMRLYGQFALVGALQYWQVDSTMLFGWPPRFWKRAATKRSHPFFSHPLLSKFGGMLAANARERSLARCKEYGLTRFPFMFSAQTMFLMVRLRLLEAPHRLVLIDLAKRVASSVWGIPVAQLDGNLTTAEVVRNSIRDQTGEGAAWGRTALGMSRVAMRDSLVVVGRGTNWWVLTHELVKGTAELICLHGLNNLSDDMYRRVVDAADHIEFEPWMLQTGGELWRRMLEVIPVGRPIAGVLMLLARLPAQSLEALVRAVIEQPQWARELLAGLET